jgi:tetratricopeptide (TPR) repeat protein
MTTIFPIYVACKNCGQQIPTVTIGSTNTCGELHTDLYQENGGAQVIDYMLTICPSCLFVDYTDNFQAVEEPATEENVLWEEMDKLKTKYTPAMQYIMLAERLEKENSNSAKIADVYLTASWSERMRYSQDNLEEAEKRPAESIDLEKRCQQKAIEYFIKIISQDGNNGTAYILYLIAELLRRTGEFTRSIEFFKKAQLEIDVAKYVKYYFVVLEDAGPRKADVAKEIRKLTSMEKKKSLQFVDNLPAVIFKDRVMEAAEEKAAYFRSYGAKTMIKEEDVLLPRNTGLLKLIDKMHAFAEKHDGSPKVMREL